MGAKGSKVQTVTRDFDVQIKFPDKAGENGEPPAVPRPDRSSNPDIIRITGQYWYYWYRSKLHLSNRSSINGIYLS